MSGKCSVGKFNLFCYKEFQYCLVLSIFIYSGVHNTVSGNMLSYQLTIQIILYHKLSVNLFSNHRSVVQQVELG